jgi:predicted small lipoprotein YifL
MRKLLALLMAAMIAMVLSVASLGQKGNDNRPPKDKGKVVERPKPDRPPSNSRGNQNDNKRGRP